MERCDLRISSVIIILVIVLSGYFPAITAETVQIKLGETIQYERLELRFYDIEDSRCPLDVTCVWEGQVLVMVNISNDTDSISAQFTPGHTVSYIVPWNVTLTGIEPHPITTEKPDYTATLDIINTKELTPPDTDPIRDYDYGLIYVVLISVLIAGMVGSMAFVIGKKKHQK